MTIYGTAMNLRDDLSLGGRPTSDPTTILINDVYHLLITERGTLPTDPEFGFGITQIILSGFGQDELPALASDIEGAIGEDDRVEDVSVTITLTDTVANMTVNVDSIYGTSFRLVGPLTDLKAEILNGRSE